MLESLLHKGPLPEREAEQKDAGGWSVQRLIQQVPSPLLVTNVGRGEVTAINAACARLWGLPAGAGALPDLQERMRLTAADPRLVPALWREHSAIGPEERSVESFLLLTDGRQLRWVTHGLDGAGAVGEVHIFEEIPRPARAAPEPDDLFRLTFEKAAVGMTLISSDFRFLRANPSFCRMLGYDEDGLLDRSLFDLIHPEDTSHRESLEAGLATGQETFHMVQRFFRSSREIAWVELSISVVRDGSGRPVYFIALAEDITDQRRAEEERDRRTRELQTLASTDPLTGLYNHRFMQDSLPRHLSDAMRTGQPLSVLMIDLDNFRELNDAFGHDAGDRALCAVAQCVRGALRENDIACRYGGDEMVGILLGASPNAALGAAARIRDRLEAVRPIAALTRPLTCSIGVASYPAHGSTAASLLKAADVALYEAKRSGKNCVRGYVPTATQNSEHQLESLGTGLQGASSEAINALVTAIDLRDRYTGAHCLRVGRLSVELAVQLECTEAEVETLRLGAPLLDVGKIGLPDYLLTKSGSLTRAEWDLMRQHPVWGEELVRRTSLPAEILQLVRWHHERLDGSGYPDALEGDQIPLLVRIVNVADVAAALREDRPHRRAWPRERVHEYLLRHAGEKLDEQVVRAYCDLFPLR
jgi:diguanylate cyclase (GGDEF)-like protein/PAS domain S-box-containing protein